MARLTYNYPTNYDAVVTYDQDQGPAVATYELDMDTDQAPSIDLDHNAAITLETTATPTPLLATNVDSDTQPKLGRDSDMTLQVEVS